MTNKEFEVKLRLADYEAYTTVTSVLSPFHVGSHYQNDNVLDGVSGELSTHHAVLLIRFYDYKPYDHKPYGECIICLKPKAVLENGVSIVKQQFELVDAAFGEECLANMDRLASLLASSEVMKRVKDEFFGGNDGLELGFVRLGGFSNLRKVYEWKGLVIEVDKTSFEFGTLYEIECESGEPEKAKELIQELLKENGVSYSNSVASKSAIFLSGKLP